MDLQSYRDEIRLALTGYLLDLEVTDATLDKVINSSLREIQRYIGSTATITTSFSPCIDLSKLKNVAGRPIKVSSISNIYRTSGFASTEDTSFADPMYAMQWQILGGIGNVYNMENAFYSYASWSTMQKTKNTLSTDLAYYFDKSANKLYINCSQGNPSSITIEYIPRFDSVEEITSDYWIDILTRLSIAQTKVIVGRIRTRYTQSGALWSQDGETILAEGNAELTELRTHLKDNAMLMYPRD